MAAIPLSLTIGSAILYILSFPPFALSPLMWVALVPFFLAVSRACPSRAAAYGVLWGVVMICGVAWCFPRMLTAYFGFSTIGGWLGFFTVSIGLSGIYFGAFAAWLSWLAGRQAATPWLIAAGWGVCEFARANLIIGNPWALSGYSQVAFTRLMQIADAAGPYGVGMLIAAVNACLAGLFASTLRPRRRALSMVWTGAALSLTLVYGEWRLSQTFATGEPKQIAVIQGAIERKFRWDPAHREANLARYLVLTKEAATTHPALIFWPEYAVDFPLQRELPQSKAVFQAARDLDAEILLGGPYYRYGEKDIYKRNSVFLVRDGRLAGRYDKLFLLPFAERDWFAGLFSREVSLYEPGTHLHVLRASSAKVGVFLCVEATYPELARRLTGWGAEILANPSNDDWLESEAQARQMLDIATVRAIENRRYLIRPTATGFSAVIDPYGRTIARSRFGSPEVLTATIRPSQAHTLYQRWGDAVAWLALAVVVAGSCSQVNGLRKNLH
jgi:apolipoprotein N-acyltransferase